MSANEDGGDFAQLSQTKLSIPLLVIAGEKSNGNLSRQQVKLVASDVSIVVFKDTGHWVMEEHSRETTDALMKFI